MTDASFTLDALDILRRMLWAPPGCTCGTIEYDADGHAWRDDSLCEVCERDGEEYDALALADAHLSGDPLTMEEMMEMADDHA